MAKIRTTFDLAAALTTDLKWRKQELFTFEKQIERSAEVQRPALLRGGIALLYAHWEGYVKTAGAAYLEYVARKNLRLGELRTELAAVAVRSRIMQMAEEKNPQSHTDLVQLLRSQDETSAAVPYDTSTIRTNANLNFKLFEAIMHSLGLVSGHHASKSIPIDERLLGWRNEIAHGRRQYVGFDDWKELRIAIEAILDDVRNQIDNAAVRGEYRKAPPS